MEWLLKFVFACSSIFAVAVRHTCTCSHKPLLKKFGHFWVRSLRVQDRVGSWELKNCVHGTTLPLHLFRFFCCMTYRLATMHSVTERQTDRQTDRRRYDCNSRSYCVQYDGDLALTTTMILGHFLPRDALVHSAVLRLHVVRPSVCLSVCLNVGGSGSHRLEILETNCTDT